MNIQDFETIEELKKYLNISDEDVKELERPKTEEYKAADGFGLNYALMRFTSREEAEYEKNRPERARKKGMVILRPGEEAKEGRPAHDGRPSPYYIYERMCPYCGTIHWVSRRNRLYCESDQNQAKYFSKEIKIPAMIFLRFLDLYKHKLIGKKG